MKEKYINDYGDILFPNDPILSKYQGLIHKNYVEEDETISMNEEINLYIRKLKENRNMKNKNTSNLILDFFKKINFND